MGFNTGFRILGNGKWADCPRSGVKCPELVWTITPLEGGPQRLPKRNVWCPRPIRRHIMSGHREWLKYSKSKIRSWCLMHRAVDPVWNQGCLQKAIIHRYCQCVSGKNWSAARSSQRASEQGPHLSNLISKNLSSSSREGESKLHLAPRDTVTIQCYVKDLHSPEP